MDRTIQGGLIGIFVVFHFGMGKLDSLIGVGGMMVLSKLMLEGDLEVC